ITMRSKFLAVLFVLSCPFASGAGASTLKPVQVLFVGNSLTYVGNLPTVLKAVLLYQQLYGVLPEAKALEVRAPVFVPGSKFAPPAPVSLPLLPEVPLAGGPDYSRDEVANAISLASGH
ncbi:MAG TPA: hypothetical protein VIC31_06005, partial [Rudaea sp.]